MPAPDVTLIAPYPPIGARHGGVSGVASYTANLAGALSAAGARVDVVAPLQDGRAADERDGAVRVRRCFARTSRGTARAFGAAVASGAPVVHLQHEFLLYGGPASNAGLAWGLRAVRRCRRASVATLHQVVDPGGVDRAFTRMHRVRMPAWLAGGGLSTMQRALSCSVDRVVVHEPAFAETVPGAAVVPHGVERATPIDRRRARATLGLEPERLCVLCFGFLAPYKGIETVLESARQTGPRVQVVVAGGEHPRLAAGGDRYAEQLRAQHGDHARFTGHVPDAQVGPWFAAADLAVFMYPRPFSSSGALALAIAHGTPVLTSAALARTAGLPDALATADRAALTARLDRLAQNRTELAPLRAATAHLAAERSWAAVAARHLELYREAADGPRTARR